MNTQIYSRRRYNKAKNRFFLLLLTLSTLIAAIIFILCKHWYALNTFQPQTPQALESGHSVAACPHPFHILTSYQARKSIRRLPGHGLKNTWHARDGIIHQDSGLKHTTPTKRDILLRSNQQLNRNKHMKTHVYSREAVQKCINTSRRKISNRESKLIHSLLAGWQHTQNQTFVGTICATQKTNTQPK